MPGVCVVGSFMMDLIAYAARRPGPGETLAGTGFVQTPGGKGFNQAVASARCGAPTSMVGCLGSDGFGDQFVAMLDDEGIDHSGVARTDATGTGVGLPVVTEDGQNSIIIVPQSNYELTPELVQAAKPAIEGASVMVMQLELPMPANIEAARIASKAGVKVVLNPAPFAPVPDELLELCDLVIPNEVELAAWLDVSVATEDDVSAAASTIVERFNTDVIVTLGSRGVMVVTRDASEFIPAYRVDAIDTVGAGDTFCGHLAALVSEGTPLADAARQANGASALAVTVRGGASSAPTRAETLDFIASRA